MNAPRILTGSIGGLLQFGGVNSSVTADRYRKTIKHNETNRAESNYTRSALAGAGLGLVLRKPGVTRARAAAIGALAGAGTQAAVRVATSGTKDNFGERPLGSKLAEKLPWQVGIAATGVLGARRLGKQVGGLKQAGIAAVKRGVRAVKKAAGMKLAAIVRPVQFAKAPIRRLLTNPVAHGAALAGGITIADVLTSAAMPGDDTRVKATGHGLVRGAIYGTGLAVAEPLLLRRLKMLRAARKFSAIVKPIQFEEERKKPSLVKTAVGGLVGGNIVRHSFNPAVGLKTVYHGTSEKNWQGIQEKGLQPKYGGSERGSGHHVGSDRFKKNSAGKVHVTGFRPIADAFSKLREGHGTMGQISKRKPEAGRVVKATISHADFRNFTPDPDMKVPGPESLQRRVASTTDKTILPTQIAGGKASIGAKMAQRFKDVRRGITASPKRTLAGIAGLAIGGKIISSVVKPWMNREKKPQSMSALLARIIQFGGREQLRGSGNRFVDPLKAASGEDHAFYKDAQGVDRVKDIGVGHAQVLRAAYNKAGGIYKHGTRAGGLLKDVHAVATGKPKEAGRKREWDKAWFKRAVGTAVVAGGVLAHTQALRKSPTYKRKVGNLVQGVKTRANKLVPDLFPTLAAKLSRVVQFDYTAPSWDVRDERGRSARVFAPGARARDRREKKWHERVGNIRKIAIAGAIATGVAGLAGGYLLGRRGSGIPRIPKPVRKPTVKPSNITRVDRSTFVQASAIPRRTVQFGMRTLKTGKFAGMVVRHGKDLPSRLRTGHHGSRAGTMHISDPTTGASMTVQRSADKLGESAKGWVGKKKAYLSNIHVPAEHRKTMAGGRSLQGMTGGVFDHFDKRGISASTIAGAYEKRDPAKRIAATHKLVQGYQKRGFRIDGKEIGNEYNVVMTRRPGAKRVQPISRPAFDRQMRNTRTRNIRQSAQKIGAELRPAVPGLAAATGASALVANAKAKEGESTGAQVRRLALPAAATAVAVAKAPAAISGIVRNRAYLAAHAKILGHQALIHAGAGLSKSRGLLKRAGTGVLRVARVV